MQLALATIRTNGGTQMREVLLRDVVEDYQERYSALERMPAVDVFFDGETYWLADGFHRYYGCRDAGLAEIPATIHAGTQRDAVLFAVGANSEHGLRRTNEDKRVAVGAMLRDPEWGQWSDRKIAEVANVGHHLVADVRAEMEQVGARPPGETLTAHGRLGKDGKKYPSPELNRVPERFVRNGRSHCEAKPDRPIGDEPEPDAEPVTTGAAGVWDEDEEQAAAIGIMRAWDALTRQRLNVLRHIAGSLDESEQIVVMEWIAASTVSE